MSLNKSLTDKLNDILDIKEAIAAAIEAKGVTVDGDFASYPDYIAQIETGGGDEPEAMTITSCDLGGEQMEAAFEAGQRNTMEVCFYGTGLTSDLDYSTLIQVSAPNQSWDVTYGSFGYIIEEDQENGTHAGVAIEYNITAPDTISRWSGDTITFTCGEFTGTIDVCSYKITGYEFVGDSSNGVNQYPNGITVEARVYFDNSDSVTDFYLNNAAKEYISSNILSVAGRSATQAEIEVSDMYTTVDQVDEYTGRGELFIAYEITPEDGGEVELHMHWGEMAIATYSFDAQVPVEAASSNCFAYNDNGTLVECNQPDSDLWEWPVGTDLYAVLDGLTDGANYFDGVACTLQPLVDGEVDGDITTFTDITDVTLDGEPFKAIRISPISGDIAGNEYEVNIEIPNNTIYSGALQIVDLSGGGDEPAAMTISSCQAGTNNTLAFETGTEETITVHFAGTGLTEDLDYESLIQVSVGDESWVVTYDNVISAAEDGTWVDIDYLVTAPSYVSMWESTITFTHDEFTDSISVCAFRIRDYEFVSDSTGGINTYPNAMTGQARVYLKNKNSDNYINDEALGWITNYILTVEEDGLDDANLEVTSYNVGSSYDDSTYEFSHYIDINYTVTPQDAEAVYLKLQWGEMDAVEYPFVEHVPVTSFTVKGIYYLNGNDKTECSQPGSDVWEMPIGPDMYVVCEKFNEGVNDYSAVYAELDGIEYNDLVDFVIDRDTYKAIRIATLDNGYSEGEYELRACIQGLDCVYEGTISMGDIGGGELPSDAVEANGVRNTFTGEDYMTYARYVDTGVEITPNTIVEADIALGDQYGNMIFGTQGSDDLHDWRVFSVGGQESQDNPGFFTYKFYFDYGSNEGSEGDYGNRIESRVVEDAGGHFHVICENGHLTVKNDYSETIVDEEGPTWEAAHEGDIVALDTLKVFQTSGVNVDSVTLYNMQVNKGDTLVRDFVPVTVNGNLKLFDYITKRYFDFMTFLPM